MCGTRRVRPSLINLPVSAVALLLVVVADEAAVEEVGASGDVGSVVGCEEGGDAGDLLGLAEAA